MSTLSRRLLGTLAAATLSAGAAVVYDSNGFESPTFSTGNLNGQDSWGVNYTSSAVQVQTAVVRSGSQAVEAQRTADNPSSCYVERGITATTGLVEVKASLRVDNTVNSAGYFDAFYVSKSDTNNDRETILYFWSNGNINVFDGGTERTVSTWTAGNWYDIDFVFDTTAQTFDLAINGSTVATDYAFLNASATSVNTLIFQEYGGQAGSKLYIDNVSVAVVPEPAALSLLLLGGWVLAHRRRS